MARRIAFRRRLCVTYHSRGRPGGSGRFATGAYGRSSATCRWAVDLFDFGFVAAAGTGSSCRGGESSGRPGNSLEHCFYSTAAH
ncbi:hypothetical protein GCM10022207_80750 [Streptomyces lannensis]|uniref:Uncharacterized protein n=1 Tax=Streptomyces lannensis TaxID=766498 RepID=A0ABP7LF89_9ACTN